MITVVITSCGRVDLLKKTIHSFNRYNTFPVSNLIVIDDSADEKKQADTEKYLERVRFVNRYGVEFMKNKDNIGQVRSIDKAYSRVTTPYIFHCEDDWEFFNPGFIEKSIDILEADENIITVWLRGLIDNNGHPHDEPIYTAKATQYYLLSKFYQGIWHGFTWNPGLRRLSDYDLIKPFSKYDSGNGAAIAECHVGMEYEKHGFRGATLLDDYVNHIGHGESTRS